MNAKKAPTKKPLVRTFLSMKEGFQLGNFLATNAKSLDGLSGPDIVTSAVKAMPELRGKVSVNHVSNRIKELDLPIRFGGKGQKGPSKDLELRDSIRRVVEILNFLTGDSENEEVRDHMRVLVDRHI